MPKHDKSEQTDITAEEYELDDCLLESNDIVITQNKDGFVLHVKKLGNITTAKLATTDEDQAAAAAVAAVTGGHQTATITELQQVPVEVKPTLTTLTTNQAIKLPSTECELINLKKIIPASTTISTHQPHAKATIIQQHQIQPSQQHQTQIQQIPTQHQQHHHQLQQAPTHAQVQSIVTTHAGQTINMMGLRNVQIEPIVSRIKYSRGKIITPTAGGSVQIVEAHEALSHQQHHELTEGTKYEISEIDLTNPNTSAAIISDLVKYAEIDDIELPDGTKIGIGFAPTEITEHIQTTSGDAHLTTIEHEPQVTTIQHQQHEHEQPQSSSAVHQMQQQQHTQIQTHHIHHQELSESEQQPQQQHQQLHQLHEHEEGVETIIPDHITVHEQTKSYTILTTRPMKTDTSDAGGETTTTTYELSLSDSSMGAVDDPEARYVCRHCGKKYRWKSTLRRHENVECGGKEPCHPCPYCTYKAKQRGNLGVHVRKHHPDKPQLESKRGRKI